MSDGMLTNTNYLVARKMLDYTTARQEALSSNLANYETPGYKRMDVSSDFQTQLQKAVENKTATAEDLNRIQPQIVTDSSSTSPRGDGNNVEMDKEMMEMNRNSVEYEYAVKYINYNYNMVRAAVDSGSAS
jgi:flagellar basal-body rod protein FlgB